ncbi:MAG: thiamine-phosphate kinase [Methanomicrobiales archaeon]|nr:thiamine-phosphate kinase [Methanomicrobiales archaeon]
MDDRALLNIIKPVCGHDTCSDDCSILKLPCATLVLSTDMLHENSDFPKGMTDWQIGWMSAAVTISDIAAMGAKPVQILLAIGLDYEERLEEIVHGAHDCCQKYSAVYAGGDLDSHNELTIVSTGIGTIIDDLPVRRSGAKPGDLICVTGTLGRAILGLEGEKRFWKDLCEPEPRVEEGVAIRRAGASAMMDISDGLALSLYDIGMESHAGIAIESRKIPIPQKADKSRALHAALFGGGDFELLFCISEENAYDLKIPYTIIGRVKTGHEIMMDGKILEKKGYLHHW